MTKSAVILLALLVVQGCSLFEEKNANPEVMILSPAWIGREAPDVRIGESIRVQAEMSIENGNIDGYELRLVRLEDNRTALSEIVHDFSDRPGVASIDTLLTIPADLTPSQTEREYSLQLTMNYAGNSSLGVGQPLNLVTE